MNRTVVNRLKRIESALKPSGKGSSGIFSPIQIWRQNDIDPTLFRPEFGGGDWVDEQTMLAALPPVVSKKRPRVVIVKGNWSQLATQQ